MLKKEMMAFAMAGTLIFGLVGCGSSSSDTSESETTAESETAVESEAAAESETSSDDEDTAEADTEGLKTVRIGTVGENNTMEDALGIAEEEGFIEEELEKVGYTAEMIGFEQAGPAINEAFVANELDMAIYGDMPALTLKSTGTDTTVFAIKNDEMQMSLLVQNDSDIQSAADLAGHTVIVSVGTIYQEYFKSLLEEEGIDEDEVEQINTFTDAASVMATNDADAYVTSSSTAYYLEDQGIGKVVQTTAERPDQTAQFFCVGKTDYLEENPEAAKAVVKASIRGMEYMLDNQEESYEILAKRAGYDNPSVYEKTYAYDESYSSMYPTIEEDNVERLKEVMDFMLAEDLITEEVDVDAFVDPSYAEEAAAEYEAEHEAEQ